MGVKINPETGESTGIKTERGYCILLEGKDGSENKLEMDFYTFDLSSDLFNFSKDILFSTYNSDNCGPVVFSDSIRDEYLCYKRDKTVHFTNTQILKNMILIY